MRILFAISLVVSCSLTTISSYAQDNLTKANNLAISGKFAEALQVYSEILSADANNTAARLGRGFTYSWNHEWGNATADFNTVLQKDPNNLDAQKGLAYVELWNGNDKKAIASFKSLIEKQPGNKELYIALGKAQLNEGLLADARKSFDKAKQLNPGDQEPELLINAIRTQPTKLDIDLLGGISTADGETKAGLRFLQLSSQVSKQVHLSVKYDNSLSLDNLGLITNSRTIPYYAGAIQYKWSRRLMTKLEGGFRNFTGAKVGEATGESQFTLEQVFFLKKGKSLKIGGAFISPNAGEDAYLLLASYHQPVSKKITAGINYFYANRNVFNTTENRFLADADFYLPKGNTINAGFYYGKSNSDVKTLTGNIYGGFIKGYFPVSNSIGIHLGVSAENNFVQNLFNVNAGFRFRLEK
jgi:tetratricopeptide (TPR) repeat protein